MFFTLGLAIAIAQCDALTLHTRHAPLQLRTRDARAEIRDSICNFSAEARIYRMKPSVALQQYTSGTELELCRTNIPSCPCAIDVPMFAISMPGSHRRDSFLKQLKRLCPANCVPQFEFVDAVHKSNWTDISLSTNFTEKEWQTNPLNPVMMTEEERNASKELSPWCKEHPQWCIATPAEIAVSVSHLKAIWKAYNFLQLLNCQRT